MDEQGDSDKTQTQKYTEGGTKYGKSERNTDTLSKHVEMWLGKPKPPGVEYGKGC